jgi:hypothetical protein
MVKISVQLSITPCIYICNNFRDVNSLLRLEIHIYDPDKKLFVTK